MSDSGRHPFQGMARILENDKIINEMKEGAKISMKIGICSDIHLGENKFRKSSGMQNVYNKLNVEAFQEAMEILQSHSDIMIIAGDLFDHPNPDVLSLTSAQMLKSDVPTFLLGGNHDYSQRNKTLGCHPFDMLNFDNLIKIYDGAQSFTLGNVSLDMIPYKHLNPESFQAIYKGKIKDSSKKRILVFHGYVDITNSNDVNDYILPREVALEYDFIIVGHNHLPSFWDTKPKILTPGSLMPSSQASSTTKAPSVYIYDTDNDTLEVFPLNSPPKIFEFITSDVNETLESLASDSQAEKYQNALISIMYGGKMQDVDEYWYQKVSDRALNLMIHTNNAPSSEKPMEEISDFWTSVREMHPEYYDEFTQMVKEN